MIERDKEYYNQKIGELYAVIENQEKIIRDLQEEVKGYQTMYFDKVMMVNKAIEYIETQIPIVKNEINIPNVNTATSELLNYGQLLEILKGGNDE